MNWQRAMAFVVVGGFISATLVAQSGDPAFARMRAESDARSRAAADFEHLTIDIGPRLTASPAHRQAANWVKGRLTEIGMSNPRLESWDFGRGWTLNHLVVEMVEPRYLPLIGYADGWSPSTNGEIVAAPVFIGGKTPEAVAAMTSTLKGALVMTQPMMDTFVRKDRPQPSEESYVANSAAYATSVGRPATPRPSGPSAAQRIAATLHAAGVGAVIKPSIGEHGTVFVTGRDAGADGVPTVTLSGEHYNMIARMLQRNIPVKLRVRVDATFDTSEAGRAYNVIAELPGSDPALRDEVVMLGAHLDSWHTGVGATDNADGVATMIGDAD
ncbi:MAG: M28 family peptidase, partial [Acidobacteriaceae bacterium]|nr:M28 family peptidase [Acidobacteriaceae bacterium]